MAIADIRNTINQNQKWSTIVFAVLIVAAVIWMWRWLLPANTAAAPSRFYFYDTASRTVFIRPSTDLPPLIGSNGKPTLVRAIFLTCGSCAARKLAYLLKYNASARAAAQFLDNPPAASAGQSAAAQFASLLAARRLQVSEGTLIRLPAPGSPWLPAMSPQGAAIIHQAQQCPGNSYGRRCQP